MKSIDKKGSWHKRKTGFSALLFCMFAILLISGRTHVIYAEDADAKVRVGWYDSPFNYYDEGGNRSGYAYEFQQQISSYTGWEYEYIEGGWYDLLQSLKNGEVDLMTDVSKTPERQEDMLFSAQPMGTEVYYVIVTADNKEIDENDYSTLNGKRIGMPKDSIPEEQYKEWENANNVHAQIVELTGDDQENADLLQNGELDAYVGVGGFEDFLQNGVPLIMVGSSDYYFAINKNRPDLKNEIDAAMQQILSINWYYIRDLADTYLTNAGAQRFLTNAEQEWLDSQNVIRIGYLDNFMPFSQYDDESEEVTGLLKDFTLNADQNMKNVEIKFETKPYQNRQELYAALKNNEIDVTFSSGVAASQAEKMELLQTDTLAKTESLAIIRKNEVKDFNPSEKHTVAVIGNVYEGTAIADVFFPGWEQIAYGTFEQELQAVAEGKVDCVLISNYQYYASRKVIEDYGMTTITTGKNPGIAFSTSKHERELYSIMNKLIDAMPTEQINSSLATYSSANQKVSFLDYVRQNIWTFFLVMAGIILMILFFLMRSMRSERKTKKLNAELIQSEKRVESESKAKDAYIAQIKTIAKMFEFVFNINLSDHTFVQFSTDEKGKNFKDKIKGDIFKELSRIADENMDEPYREEAHRFHDPTTLQERLRGTGISSLEIHVSTTDRWYRLAYIGDTEDESGDYVDVMFVAGDITEDKKQEIKSKAEAREYRSQMYLDSLMETFNRKYLDEVLMSQDCQAVVMADIDYFKTVNDTYGHKCGDHAIAACANALRANVRSGDTVIRYGGDEFAIIFDHIPQTVLARKLEDIRSAVENLRMEEYPQCRLTMSFGAFYGSGVVSKQLAKADEALYVSKQKRNTVTVNVCDI